MSQWYYSKGLKPQGPLSRNELLILVQKGEIRPRTLLLCEELSPEWLEAKEFFRKDILMFPVFQLLRNRELDLKCKEWVVLKVEQGQGQQLGPYSLEEIRVNFNVGSSLDIYLWKPEITGWIHQEDLEEFISQRASFSEVSL
ncbi:MAG: DUF4339 domain-containing protein [Bdellovibrionia bacterium]